jgi:hypothetical protein
MGIMMPCGILPLEKIIMDEWEAWGCFLILKWIAKHRARLD